MSFTHLHVASTFSPGHGTATPAELAAAAARLGATALACTDRDGLYGAVDHVVACRDHGLQPVLGVSLAVLEPCEEGPRGRISGRVVVLARGGGAGYRALCLLVADAHAQAAARSGTIVPVGVTRQELAARSVDPASGQPALTVLLGPESDVGLAMQGPRYLRPRTLFKEWLAAMPTGTLAAEVVSHHEAAGLPYSTGHAARMLKLAREHHVPAILSNAVRHLSPSGNSTARRPAIEGSSALTLVRTDRTPGQVAGHAHLKDLHEMEQTAREIGHAADLRVNDLAQLLRETELLAEGCRLDPATDLGWGSWMLPEPTVLGLTQDPQAELAERCRAALDSGMAHGRGTPAPGWSERLAQELAVVEAQEAAPFLLAAAEAVGTIRDLGVRVSARSGTTASAVTHLLGLSPAGANQDENCSAEEARSLSASTAPDGAEQGDGEERSVVFPAVELDVEAGRLREVHRALARRFGKARVIVLGSTPATGTAPSPTATAGGEPTALVEVADPSDCLPGGLSRLSSGLILGDASLPHRIPSQPGAAGLPLCQYTPETLSHWGVLRIVLRESAAQTVIARSLRKIHARDPEAALMPDEAEPSEEALALLGFQGSPADPIEPADALAARQLSWLSSHHPAEFIAALWDSPAGSPPRHVLRAEARRRGIPLLPLDVNASAEECEAQDGTAPECPAREGAAPEGAAPECPPRECGAQSHHPAPDDGGTSRREEAPVGSRQRPVLTGTEVRPGLRPGLRDVPGLSSAERRRLLAGRPYRTVEELITRAGVSGGTVRKLAEAGALDSLPGTGDGQGSRAALVRNLQELAGRPVGVARSTVRGQLALPLGDRPDDPLGAALDLGAPEADPEADPEAGTAPHAAAAPGISVSAATVRPLETPTGQPAQAAAGLTAVTGPSLLSRARTPGRSESPQPTSHRPDPERRTGSE